VSVLCSLCCLRARFRKLFHCSAGTELNDIFEFDVVFCQHPSPCDEWVLDHADVLHQNALHPFTCTREVPLVVMTLGRAYKLCLAAIIHHNIFQRGDDAKVFHVCKYVNGNSPYRRAGVAGRKARGTLSMTSAGFNWARQRRGKVWTYWLKKVCVAIQLAVWRACTKLCRLVGRNVRRAMGRLVLDVLRKQVEWSYTEPLTRLGLVFAARCPPVLRGLPCNSIQQTCNAHVKAHKDGGDLYYTLINWVQSGDVTGDFLIHHLGYGVPIKVTRL